MNSRMYWSVPTLVISAAMIGTFDPSSAQSEDGPVSRVSFTEVRRHQVSERIELPGTVEAPRSSKVASEVEGVATTIHAREGQHIKKGAPLVALGTDQLELELDRARGDLREAEARLALAKTSLDRSVKLHEEGVLSRQLADDARFEHQAWRGRVDRLEAEIARLTLDKDRATVKAPFAGVVVLESVELGEWVAKGATVIELVSPYVLEVRVDVPEAYFGSFQPGGLAEVRFESLPGLEADGKIVSLVPRASTSSRTFPMKVRVTNEAGRMAVGMLAQVSLSAGASRSTLIVPKDAVITRGTQRFVYRLEEQADVQTVDLVPVETGTGIGEWIEVDGSLPPATKVVTRGNERLRPGQRVVAEHLAYRAP